MCRIFSVISREELNVPKAQDSLSLLHRGGPDGSGEFIKNNIFIGHRRLSIIDLSNQSSQPFVFKNIVISYNGEVYNFLEIKEDLIYKFAATFTTTGDTEVIAQAYFYYGKEFIKLLYGFFALIIYDQNLQKIFAYRDFFGVKPLYYGIANNHFFLSSELKSIHHFNKSLNLNFNAVGAYFQKGFIEAPMSIYENIYKLQPSSILCFDLSNFNYTTEFYDNLNLKPTNFSLKYPDLIEEIHELLKISFKKRLVADVPITVLLSGGLDSSLVTSMLAKENVNFETFTIGFENKKYDESIYAQKIANYVGVKNNTFICSEQDFINKIQILPKVYDEPFGDSSAIPTLLVSEYIQNNNFKVTLSSDGGDEIFAGYQRYIFALKLNKYKFLLNKNVLQKFTYLTNTFNANNQPIFGLKNPNGKLNILIEIAENIQQKDLYKHLLHTNKDKELHAVFKEKIYFKDIHFEKNLDFITNMCITDIHTYLVDDILTKIDRATMYYGVEGREPFLDKHILETMIQAPAYYKIKGNKGKIIIRDILNMYLPTKLFDRPKMGFGIPLENWVNGFLKEEIKEITHNQFFLDKINIDKNKLLKNKYLLTNINFRWYLYNIYKWYNYYLK